MAVTSVLVFLPYVPLSVSGGGFSRMTCGGGEGVLQVCFICMIIAFRVFRPNALFRALLIYISGKKILF